MPRAREDIRGRLISCDLKGLHRLPRRGQRVDSLARDSQLLRSSRTVYVRFTRLESSSPGDVPVQPFAIGKSRIGSREHTFVTMSFPMMSEAQLEWYRRMTPRERTRLMLELMDVGWSILRRRGDDAVRRSVSAIADLHRASTRALAEGLEKARSPHGQPPIQ